MGVLSFIKINTFDYRLLSLNRSLGGLAGDGLDRGKELPAVEHLNTIVGIPVARDDHSSAVQLKADASVRFLLRQPKPVNEWSAGLYISTPNVWPTPISSLLPPASRTCPERNTSAVPWSWV